MKIIEDYLKKELGRAELNTWQEIRVAYMERAFNLVKNDWQSPSYLSSLENQAGRRVGQITGNINDYTRDMHDLARAYEKKFVREYLPRMSVLPSEAYVTSSGMAALTTIIVMMHRLYGTKQVVFVGSHSYFQNQELLTKSFEKVITFNETNENEWKSLINECKPRAVFVDSLCNEPNLTRPPINLIAKYLAEVSSEKTYLVVDNSMLATMFDWRSVLKYRNRKLEFVGWESLNKYYQFGLDRTTGGVVWSSPWMGVKIDQARRHAGTIISDMAAAMLVTPNRKMLDKYLARISRNRVRLQEELGDRCLGDGAQVVVKFETKKSYSSIQKIIKTIVKKARKARVQIAAGTSFGLPSTRVYVTARQTEFTQMFLRVSCGTEEDAEFEQVIRIIIDNL